MSQLAGFVQEYGLYMASLLAFIAIVVWIFRPSAKERYRADGGIPFDEDKRPGNMLGPVKNLKPSDESRP